jgi:SAM-dependent methyltransferase
MESPITNLATDLPPPYAPPPGTLSAETRRTWHPPQYADLADGEALHRFLYQDGDLRTPRRWCSFGARVLVDWLTELAWARIAQVRAGTAAPRLRILDFGTGTGFQAIELLKAWHERGLLAELAELGVDFKLYLTDIPSVWFAKGFELLRGHDNISFFPIRDEVTGRFLPLSEVLDGERVDVVLASMVFHLIPVAALPSTIDSIAGALEPHGALLLSTPDLGPRRHGALLGHDPNRALRRAVLEMIGSERRAREILACLPGGAAELEADLAEARARLTPERATAARRAADRQILPEPTDVSLLKDQLARAFHGELVIAAAEMLIEDAVHAILIPANQRYLGEIEDPEARARISRRLMTDHVMPRITAGHAGTGTGYRLQWTLGRLTKSGGEIRLHARC